MGPDSYDATDGKIIVGTYAGTCYPHGKEILDTLAARANREELNWQLMADVEFADSIKQCTCMELKKKEKNGTNKLR